MVSLLIYEFSSGLLSYSIKLSTAFAPRNAIATGRNTRTSIGKRMIKSKM